jgi:peptide/nickel transport system permease protein
MGITSWTGLCRVLRGETMKLREMEFIQSARAMGVPAWKILARHIVPNVLHVVLITAVLRFSDQVLAEAALTYMGIGVDPSVTVSWGQIL